jgi:hypothetical protein
MSTAHSSHAYCCFLIYMNKAENASSTKNQNRIINAALRHWPYRVGADFYHSPLSFLLLVGPTHMAILRAHMTRQPKSSKRKSCPFDETRVGRCPANPLAHRASRMASIGTVTWTPGTGSNRKRLLGFTLGLPAGLFSWQDHPPILISSIAHLVVGLGTAWPHF